MVNEGKHSLELLISSKEYEKVYDEYNNEIASTIVNHHLDNRGDDGRATDVRIKHDDSDIVRIYANVNYLDNDHTRYGRR